MKNILFLLTCLLSFNHIIFSQTLLPDFFVTNGSVNTIVEDGGTLYVGGSFTHVGPNAPFGSAIDLSGVPDPGYARPDSYVNAVVPDGSGGWYIGGTFTRIAGEERMYLADSKF